MSSLAPTRPLPIFSRLLDRLQLGRHKGLLVAGVLLVGLAPPAYLLQTGGALTTGYTIQRLQDERQEWMVKNDQLGAEIARAKSLAWIEAEAVNRLGMRKPAQQTLIRVDVVPPSPVAARQATEPAAGARQVGARAGGDAARMTGGAPAERDAAAQRGWGDALAAVFLGWAPAGR